VARTAKNSAKPRKKPGIVAKLKGLVKGKKATPRRAIKNVVKAKKKSEPRRRVNPEELLNPAQSPGHRKMNLKAQKGKPGAKVVPQNDSALNNMARDERITRNINPMRRIISGASLNKKGQRARD